MKAIIYCTDNYTGRTYLFHRKKSPTWLKIYVADQYRMSTVVP